MPLADHAADKPNNATNSRRFISALSHRAHITDSNQLDKGTAGTMSEMGQLRPVSPVLTTI
jgi:hypothetical protein